MKDPPGWDDRQCWKKGQTRFLPGNLSRRFVEATNENCDKPTRCIKRAAKDATQAGVASGAIKLCRLCCMPQGHFRDTKACGTMHVARVLTVYPGPLKSEWARR